MANKSDWKGFEKMVAAELGGKRRLRTMESFGKVATDVYFPKSVRRKYPRVKKVAVECKKRRAINVHAIFSEAMLKYSQGGKRLILASKVPVKGDFGKRVAQLKLMSGLVLGRQLKKVRRKYLKKYNEKIPHEKYLKIKKRLLEKRKLAVEKSIVKLKHRHNIAALVTVELSFFRELWEAWINDTTRD